MIWTIRIFIDDKGKYNELKAEPVQGGFKLEGVDGIFKLSFNPKSKIFLISTSWNVLFYQ